MKTRRDATRPNTYIRLFDGQTTEWMLSNVKIFILAGKCARRRAFYLALCSYAPAILTLKNGSLTLSAIHQRSILPSLSLSLFCTLSLSLDLLFSPFNSLSFARALSRSLSDSLMLSIHFIVIWTTFHLPSLPFAGRECAWNVPIE